MHSPSGKFLLFVYGTLKRGGSRHGPLATQRYRGETHTRPSYALYNLGEYPGLAPADPGQAVHGEVYEVEESLLSWLDAVEGAPEWFARAPLEVEGFTGNVWAYFYQGDPSSHPLVASGRWENTQ